MNKQRPIAPPVVLAVASGGGHWVQLRRLRPSFVGSDVHYATVHPTRPSDVNPEHFHLIPDANQRQPLALIRLIVSVVALVATLRPDVIVTTGAAPGFVAVALGRLTGARTMFIDSIANAHQPSLSAKLARSIAHATLTQWPTVAESYGLTYLGGVL